MNLPMTPAQAAVIGRFGQNLDPSDVPFTVEAAPDSDCLLLTVSGYVHEIDPEGNSHLLGRAEAVR